MQVIHIIPGSGGSFYCGNCLRDSTIVGSLRKTGNEVLKVPMYLPLFSDEHDLGDTPVFYGAISLYLRQNYAFFRNAPGWLDKVLNSGPMLKLAAHMAGSTRSHGLEDMTISMLLGEEGQQSKELDHLVDWIAEHCQPDVIHLSNALLLGLARRMKEKLDVIIACSLQDEDTWVNAMDDRFKGKTWALMRERGRDVDAFFGVSDYYSNKMQVQLNIPQHKLFSLHIGVNPDDYEYINTAEKPPNIGFISRMFEDNGLGILVDAFILLKEKPGMEPVKLVISGGYTGDDKPFIKSIQNKIKKAGLWDQVDFHDDFEGEGRREFFRKVSVISVPVLLGEAFGLYLLEAMASGIPVVQPNLGAFSEIISISQGGVVYDPNSPEILARNLENLLDNPEKLHKLSKDGRAGVEKHFNMNIQAAKMVDIYQQVKARKNSESYASKNK